MPPLVIPCVTRPNLQPKQYALIIIYEVIKKPIRGLQQADRVVLLPGGGRGEPPSANAHTNPSWKRLKRGVHVDFTLLSYTTGDMDVDGMYRTRREGGQHTPSLTFWAVSGQHASEHCPPAKSICYELTGSQKSHVMTYGCLKRASGLGEQRVKEQEEQALLYRGRTWDQGPVIQIRVTAISGTRQRRLEKPPSL